MNGGRRRHVGTTNGAPAYRRIATDIWEQIQSGELQPGARLPNETELAESFGVTRLTLRQAVIELQRLGAVEIRRGIGTFVVSPPDLVEIIASVPSTKQQSDATVDAVIAPPVQRSARPVRKVDEIILGAAPAAGPSGSEAARHLGREIGSVRRLDTVMMRSGRPWISNSYWYGDSGDDLVRLVEEHGLVVSAFVNGLGLDLRYRWRAFSAVAADFDDAAILRVPTGTALLVRDGVTGDGSGNPVFYVRRRLRGDEAKFVLRYDTDSGGDDSAG